MIFILKICFAAVLLFMCYEVFTTSLESNLFVAWGTLAKIPWMRATLWDFYANVLVISLWVCYKEPHRIGKIGWVMALILLGSIATSIYILIQLFKLKKGEGLKALFLNQNQIS